MLFFNFLTNVTMKALMLGPFIRQCTKCLAKIDFVGK